VVDTDGLAVRRGGEIHARVIEHALGVIGLNLEGSAPNNVE